MFITWEKTVHICPGCSPHRLDTAQEKITHHLWSASYCPFLQTLQRCTVSVLQSWAQRGARGHGEAGKSVHVAAQWRRKRRMQLLLTQNTMSMHPKTGPKSQLETWKRLQVQMTMCIQQRGGESSLQQCPRDFVRWKWADEQRRWSITSMPRQNLSSGSSGLDLNFLGPEEKILTLLIANFLCC